MRMKEFFTNVNATYCNVDLTYIHFVSQTFYSLKAIHSLNSLTQFSHKFRIKSIANIRW